MSKELIEVIQPVNIPEEWDYDHSISKFRNLYKEVRTNGEAALVELRVAHGILTEDSKKKEGRKFPDKTFKTYCGEIGIDKKTAYNWLRRYLPSYLPPRKVKNSTVALLEDKPDTVEEIIDYSYPHENPLKEIPPGYEISRAMMALLETLIKLNFQINESQAYYRYFNQEDYSQIDREWDKAKASMHKLQSKT
jgi:hypothetical protein